MHLSELRNLLSAEIIVFAVSVAGCHRTSSPIILSEFIFESACFASAHASTIVRTGTALVAAWFGGTAEGRPDVGIWISRNDSGRWSIPVKAADGVLSDGRRFPCWNPVLFQPDEGPLLLFFKIGPNPGEWKGFVKISEDQGQTWSEPVFVLENFPGEYSYPAMIRTPDGLVHITCTWRCERIKHVILDPSKIKNAARRRIAS